MSGRLVVSGGSEQGQEAWLSSDRMILGRSGASDIVLADDQVSRRHAELRNEAGAWYVRDLDSSNGTFVNGRRLAADERVALQPGDRIRLGAHTEVRFDLATPPTATPVAAWAADAEAAPPARSKAPLIAAAALLVVLLAAGGAWAFLRGGTDTAKAPAAVTKSTAAVVMTPRPTGITGPTATPLAERQPSPAADLPTVAAPAGKAAPPAPPTAPPVAAPAAGAPPAAANPTVSAAPPAAGGAAPSLPASAPGNIPLEQLPAIIAAAFPGATGEQLPGLFQQALQSGQIKPEAVQQMIAALFPGIAPAQLPAALAGSFAGFNPQQIEQLLGAIYPGQNLKAPAIPSGQGAVAFTVWQGDQPGIYLMNADGSGKKLLIAQASEPAFSPDGKRLAFYSWRSDALGLRILEVDTGKQTPLTTSSEDAYPTWSPDGARLVFWELPSGIAMINADGTGRRAISRGEFPALSPRGDRIAAKGCIGNDCGILLMNTDGSNRVRITTNPNDGQPAWSPDGRDIAFVSNRDGNWEIYAVKVDGSWLRRITNDIHTDGLPAWAADGARIAFRSDRSGVWAIYTATGVGGPPIKLTDAAVNTTGKRQWTWEKISWR